MGQVPKPLAHSCAFQTILSVRSFFCHQRNSEGRTDVPREAIGPIGSNSFSRDVHTRMSKETYSHFWIRPCYLGQTFFIS